MVMTILEAQVPPGKTDALEEAYKKAVEHLDPGITETFLLHNAKDSNLWRIATLWESREALDAMKCSGKTPRGIQIFREAAAEPTLTVFDVEACGSAEQRILENCGESI